MRIAVTSQNRKSITGHAGKCSKFFVYSAEPGQPIARQLIEIDKEQSMHHSHTQPQALGAIDVLVSGGMGDGLKGRLQQSGIQVIVTAETDPDHVVAAILDNRVDTLAQAETHHCSCNH